MRISTGVVMDGIFDGVTGVDETGMVREAGWKGKGEITLAQGRPSQ
jgi:hypothetical protein